MNRQSYLVKMREKSNEDETQKGAAILSKVSLILLFGAIFAVYIFSAFKFLYGWIDEPNPGPAGLLDHDKIYEFLNTIGFISMMGRYIFIFVIIGVFILSLLLLVAANSKTEKLDDDDETMTIVIHDDVLQCQKDDRTKMGALKDEFKDRIWEPDNFYTLGELFERGSKVKIFIKVLNIMMIFASLGIAWTFYRGSSIALETFYYLNYLYTDEASIIIDASMLVFIANFVLHTPVFVKAFASTGFKRIHLKKYHIHESFVGTLLTIAGVLLLMNGAGGGAYFERMCGIFMLILGMFMIGRDWKDFILGKFLKD